jgi:hypothetical protein
MPASTDVSIPTTIPLATTPAPSIPTTTNDPYLIYRKSINGQEMLVIMDADGQEQRTQLLPAGSTVGHLVTSVSPNGKWLAFHSGSAEVQSGTGYDLALNLMDLSNGQTQVVTPLLSADYPDNFRMAAEDLTQQGITFMEGVDSAIFLRDAFSYGIRSLAWSPDGKYLAFAGQMDGFSSDLYTYDLETRMIRRLSDGIEQIQSITWSPDGRWILHGSANIVGAGAEIDYHAAAVDGSKVKTLFSGIASIRGWLAPDRYLQWNVTDNRLQSVDIETGNIESLWQGSFITLALDPTNDMLAVIGSESVTGQRPIALFLVDLSNGAIHKVKEAVSRVEFVGIMDKRFIATAEGKTFFVMADGSCIETGFDANRTQVSASPDLRIILVFNDYLRVYAWGGELVGEIDLTQPPGSKGRVIWRPDLPGVFVTFDSKMYAVNFLDEKAHLVDENMPGSWELDYTFSPPASIEAEAVWDAPRDSEFADCAFSSAAPPRCAVSVMRVSGASPQAMNFTRLVHGQAYMTSFIESGKVDVARMVVLPRPNDILQYVMVNGTPRIVYAADDLGQIDITKDPNYPALLAKYPGLTFWESLNNFEGVEQLPEGGQRFIFSYDLVDGCHICRTGSSAFVAFDFNRTGQFLGTKFLYLKE